MIANLVSVSTALQRRFGPFGEARQNRLRRRALAIGVVSVMLASTACAAPVTTTDPAAIDPAAIVIVMSEEPDSLDACDSSKSTRSRILRRNVTESLTWRNPDTGAIEPLLATSWASDDSATWTFDLRSDVSFHNGEAFDAAAVVTWFERLFNPDLACDDAGDFFYPPVVESVEATGDLQVQFVLEDPDPIFPLRLTFMQIGAPSTPTDNKGSAAIGTGPYMISDWAKGQHVRLSRFDGYWGDRPSIASAEFQWRSESPVRVGMVSTGEADLAHGIAAQDAPTDGTAKVFANGETTYFRIDTLVAPLDDVRLRMALNLSIDRQGIIDSAFGGFAEPASELFMPTTLGFNRDLEPWAYDPQRATALVSEAAADGVDVTKEIILYSRPDFYPNAREVAEILEYGWEAIGLSIKIEFVDGSTWGDILLTPHEAGRPPNILQSSHGNATGDASFTLYTKQHCEGSQSAQCDQSSSDLMVQAATLADAGERAAAFAEVLRLQRDVIGNVPLAYMQGILVLSSRLSYTPTIQSDFELIIANMTVSQ